MENRPGADPRGGRSRGRRGGSGVESGLHEERGLANDTELVSVRAVGGGWWTPGLGLGYFPSPRARLHYF